MAVKAEKKERNKEETARAPLIVRAASDSRRQLPHSTPAINGGEIDDRGRLTCTLAFSSPSPAV